MSRSLKKRRLAALDTLFEINKEYVSEQQKEINVDNEKSFDKEKFILMLQSKNKSQATSGDVFYCRLYRLCWDLLIVNFTSTVIYSLGQCFSNSFFVRPKFV